MAVGRSPRVFMRQPRQRSSACAVAVRENWVPSASPLTSWLPGRSTPRSWAASSPTNARRPCPRPSRSAASASPRRSRPPSRSSSPTGRATSTARPSRSTAASTCTESPSRRLAASPAASSRHRSCTMSSTVSREAAKRFELSELANKHVFRRLIPFLLLMYIIAFLDRSNLAFAQDQFKINNGISASAYALGAGLFFAGYAIFEIPSNIMLHKVGARWWLARIMVSWGIVSTCFMFVNGTTSFYVLRILLGIAEAGFFPGVILFLTYWVPARHLNRARGIFYMGIALAGIIGNPLSGSLLDLDGFAGLRGTQWMFLVEGVLAIVVGVWAYFYLTDRPEQAQWMDPAQRQALCETLNAEHTAK